MLEPSGAEDHDSKGINPDADRAISHRPASYHSQYDIIFCSKLRVAQMNALVGRLNGCLPVQNCRLVGLQP